MIGIWQFYADVFLYIAGVAMLATFGIPLLVAPMRWARLFRWEVPQTTQLAAFLGRSLGVFCSILAVFAIKAAQNPAGQPFFFELMLWIVSAMLALHVYGALKKSQPVTETVEIFLWVILLVATLCFYPA